MGHSKLAAQEHPFEIDSLLAIPFLLAQEVKPPEDLDGGVAAQNIKPPKLLGRPVDCGPDLVHLAHVRAEKPRPPPRFLDLTASGLSSSNILVHKAHSGSLSGKESRCGPADPTGRSRDHNHLICESFH
jgi:hypothetical protein